MMLQSFVFVVLLSITSQVVLSQDIVFPGETERPSRFPIRPTEPTFRPPNNNENQFPTQLPPVTTTASNAAYDSCFQSCGKTSEYNPTCGSDGVVYFNPSNLACAKLCGRNTEFLRFGQCPSNDNTRG